MTTIHRRRPARSDAGFSLVEVLMAMLVMSLLGLAVVGTISSVARSSLAANNRLQATNTVQTLADRLSKSLRSAHPMNTTPISAFEIADARRVKFYTDAGDPTGPRLVDVSVSGSGPQETMTQVVTLFSATVGYTGPSTTQVIALGNVDATSALFTFYDAADVLLAVPMATPALSAPVARISLTLTTHEKGLSIPTTVTSSIYLRNVEYR